MAETEALLGQAFSKKKALMLELAEKRERSVRLERMLSPNSSLELLLTRIS